MFFFFFLLFLFFTINKKKAKEIKTRNWLFCTLPTNWCLTLIINKRKHTHTDVNDTEKKKYIQKINFSFFMYSFKDDVSYVMLNDRNEQKHDHKICTQMV